MKQKYWFYIEPYTSVFRNKNSILVYNCINSKHKEYPNELAIRSFFNKILQPRNNRVISISEKEFIDDKTNILVNDLREIHVGDILKKEWSKNKPTQLTPILNLQCDIESFSKNRISRDGSAITNKIFELSIYINNSSSKTNPQYKNAFKQTLLPYSEKNQKEIGFSTIQKLITGFKGSSLGVINIIGGNIFLHSEIKEIINFLNKQNLKINYYFNIDDYQDSIGYIELINQENSYLTICVLNSFSILRTVQNIFILCFKNFNYKFVIENEEDLFEIKKYIKESILLNYSFYPLYNKRNFDFFKENVFITYDDLFNTKHNQLEIFQKEKINTNFFGKIIILANGDIFSNINEKKLGNILTHDLNEISLTELSIANSWFLTRMKVQPCSDCIYSRLCPPISNYEIVIGKMNLCTHNPHQGKWQAE
jgi:pseudo-rSAM protein